MYIWIWVTIAAALSQSLRTAQQKNLQPVLGNLGASFVRFSYAIPFAWAWIFFYSIFFDVELPELNLLFRLKTIIYKYHVYIFHSLSVKY